MTEQQNNSVKKQDWGYELIWADANNYCGKILVFEKQSKTPFYFHKEIEKSWFVNDGQFKVRWTDTKNGQIFESNLGAGQTFHVKKFMPHSLECVSPKGSLTEVNTGNNEDDYFITISEKNF